MVSRIHGLQNQCPIRTDCWIPKSFNIFQQPYRQHYPTNSMDSRSPKRTLCQTWALHLAAGTPWMKIRSVQTNDRICLTDVRGTKTGRLSNSMCKASPSIEHQIKPDIDWRTYTICKAQSRRFIFGQRSWPCNNSDTRLIIIFKIVQHHH